MSTTLQTQTYHVPTTARRNMSFSGRSGMAALTPVKERGVAPCPIGDLFLSFARPDIEAPSRWPF